MYMERLESDFHLTVGGVPKPIYTMLCFLRDIPGAPRKKYRFLKQIIFPQSEPPRESQTLKIDPKLFPSNTDAPMMVTARKVIAQTPRAQDRNVPLPRKSINS